MTAWTGWYRFRAGPGAGESKQSRPGSADWVGRDVSALRRIGRAAFWTRDRRPALALNRPDPDDAYFLSVAVSVVDFPDSAAHALRLNLAREIDDLAWRGSV